MKVLLVCLGNICRSPMAEGILRKRLSEMGLNQQVQVDSAGTGAWHQGEAADPRTQAVLKKNNAYFEHCARRVVPSDAEYDFLLVMDQSNLQDLQRLLPNASHRIELILDYVGGGEVADPYYGGPTQFDEVYATLERAIEAFLQQRIQGKV